MAIGGGVFVAAVLRVALVASRDRQLADSRSPAAYMPFAVIVLFQSDIRRALAHLGRAPFFRYFAKAESAEDAHRGDRRRRRACCRRSAIGAIIVVERQIGLRSYVEGGIPLDASAHLRSAGQHLSERRRRSTTAPSSFRRIASPPRLLLPLTVNPKLSKELGSRHRAGDRLDRGERRGRRRRLRGDRQHLDRGRRPDRTRTDTRASADAAARAGAASEERARGPEGGSSA